MKRLTPGQSTAHRPLGDMVQEVDRLPAPPQFWQAAVPLAWRVPELPTWLFLGLLASLLAAPTSHLLRDLDVGWLIRYGEFILQTGRLPEADVFSFTRTGEKWTLYQWGFLLYLGGLHRLAGLGGVVWGAGVIVALTFALLLFLVLRLGVHRLLALGLTILAMAATSHYWLARPGSVNFLFYLITLGILEEYRRAPGRQLWGLPFLFLMWANLHIGFVVGLMVVILYGLWGWLAPGAFRGPGASRDSRILLVLPFCIGALCLNPYGPRLLTYGWGATSSSFLNDNILELQSPNFHNPASFPFLAQLALLLWLEGGSAPGRSLFLALITLTLFLALYSGRHLTFFSLTATLVLAQRLGDRGWKAREPRSPPGQGWAWGVLGAFLLLGAVMGVHRWHPGYHGFDPQVAPAGVAAFLQSQDSPRPVRVFSQDDQWASYLIYQLHPRALFFMDSRYEFYGEGFIKHSWELLERALRDPRVLDSWEVDYLILNRKKLLAAPDPGPDWALAYQDTQALVYHRGAGKTSRPERPRKENPGDGIAGRGR